MLKRLAFFVYGVTGHLLFLVVYAWLGCFVADIVVSKTIDSPAAGSMGRALAVDLGLVALFALQHSVMARPGFKRLWTKIVPQPIERATYVFASNAVVIVLMLQWQAIDVVVWDVAHPAARAALIGLLIAGWLMVPAVSLLINHFDLFGTRQVWLHLLGKEYTGLPFRTPLLYGRVRHPLYLGWALALWATPTMTVGHLLFAASQTVYMGLAAILEERDLVAQFGHEYAEYRRRVPMFVPRLTTHQPSPEVPEPVDSLSC